MRWQVFGVALAAFMGTAGTVSAQEPSGPPTLENLLQGGKQPTARPAVVDASEPQSKSVRPAGTFVRPKDGYKCPDLDKAWAEYDAAVSKAADSIKAALTRQISAATSKGDLAAVEKWGAALERFEKDGKLAAEAEKKAIAGAVVAELQKAKDKLITTYEDSVKAMTMANDIKAAKAVRDESKTLFANKAQKAFVVGRTGEDFTGPNIHAAVPDGQPDMHLQVADIVKKVRGVTLASQCGPSSWSTVTPGNWVPAWFVRPDGVHIFINAPGQAFDAAEYKITLHYADGSNEVFRASRQ